jgi:hypothetical protein
MTLLFRLAVLSLAFCEVSCCSGQEITPEEEADIQEEYHEQYALEESIRLHPFDLNTVTYEQLLALTWLPPSCAQAIIEFRRKKRQFQSSDELLKIECMTTEIYERLTAVVTVFTKESRVAVKVRQRLFSPLADNTANEEYLGTPAKLYTNLKIGDKERWNLVLLMEKDPGEKQVDDHFVFSHEVSLSALHTRVVTGHFSVDYSQGLVFGNPSGVQSSSDLLYSSAQKHRGLGPYHSTDENRMLCGIGVQTTLGKIDYMSFYSYNRIDATMKKDSVISLYQSGYHRTLAEIKKKDVLRETVCGSTLSLNLSEYSGIGMAIQFDSFAKSFVKNTTLENIFDFTGNENLILGINAHFLFRSLYFFIELACKWNGGSAYVTGAMCNYQDFKLLCSWFHCDVDYVNFHGSGFSSGTSSCHEQRFQYGWQWQFNRSTQISLTCNHIINLWPKTHLILPEGQNGLLCQLNQKLFNGFKFQLFYKKRKTPHWEKIIGISPLVSEESVINNRENIGFRLDYNLNKNLTLKLKSEWILTGDKEEGVIINDSTGFMISDEVVLSFSRAIKFISRYTIFQTTANSTSFYVYESDLPGVLRSKRLNGLGHRWYMMCGIKKHGMGLFCKFEQTVSDNFIVKAVKKSQVSVEKAISLQIDIEL